MALKEQTDLSSLYTEKKDSITQQLHLTRHLVMLHAASTSITSSLESGEVLDTATRELANMLDSPLCVLRRWDQDRNIFTLMTRFDPKDRFGAELEKEYSPYDYTHIKGVVEESRAAQLAIGRPHIDEAERRRLENAGFKSLLVLPLIYHNQVMGIYEVYNDYERWYDRDMVLIAMLFASQAAIAIQNANLFMKTQQSLQDQKMLRESALMMSSTLDIKEILARTAEQICSFVNATSVYISKYDQIRKTIMVIAEHYGSQASDRERVSDLGVEYNLQEGYPETLKMIETGKPDLYFVDDRDLGEIERARLEKFGGFSVLEIPLKVAGRFNTIISIWDSRCRRAFTENEVNLSQMMSIQAATAIDNARLYEHARREADQRQQAEADLQFTVMHDALTRLPNRALFLDRLERAILRKNRYRGSSFSLLYLDLDHYKMINDSLGHSTGDRLLMQIAGILKSSIREVDTIARCGGDEFGILMEGNVGVDEAQIFANRILDLFKQPICLNGQELVISTCIGIATSELDYNSPEEYLKDAEIAMYQAKSNGRNGVEVINNDLRRQASNRLTLVAELRSAIQNQDFVLHYQPIISLVDKQPIGFEALVRWRKASGALEYPDKFISQIEENALIQDLGDLVLDQAGRQLLIWQKQFSNDPPLSMSVNISSHQLSKPGFVNRTKLMLDNIGLPPENMILEITENALIQEMEAVALTLNYLRDLGFKVHLDDFGTGYSSLTYLRNLNINALKIDRSFIKDFDLHKKDRGLVSSIVSMGNNLGLDIIAEGIETREQAQILCDIGCGYGQGFYFQKGQDAKDSEHFLKDYFKQVH